MPINKRTGLSSQSKKLGLVNPNPGEIRQVLEDCLVTAWEDNVISQGLPLEGNSLISRYWIQRNTSIPAIWLGNPPDENKADREGCEIVVMPDPQPRDNGPRSRTMRWTLSIFDRSITQDRIFYVMQVLRLQFNRGLYYVPRTDAVEEDIDYHNGLILIDLVDSLRGLSGNATIRDELRLDEK